VRPRSRGRANCEVNPCCPSRSPKTIGLDSKRLQVAYDLLEKWCKEGSVPGGAILVGRKGRAVAAKLYGRMGPNRTRLRSARTRCS